MKVALVSLYDDRCYGLRHIASHLRALGHEVWLLCFKRFQSVVVPREDRAAWRRMMAATVPPVTEAHEEGTVFCPYLHPATGREWQLLLEKIAAIGPELIGMSVTTATYDVCRDFTGRIHREMPGVPIVWGGIHPTIQPEQSLGAADMVCVGEGEHAMAELCADPQRRDVAGLWRRNGSEIIRTSLRPLEQDLDRFPFPSFGENEWLFENDAAVELLPGNKPYFQGVYTIMTQRGCPFACTYCMHHAVRQMFRGERYLRRRSVENVLAECAQRARDFDLPGFGFYDDVFVINRKWIAEFAAKYPSRVGLPFGGYAYPGVSTEDMLAQLRQAGMIFIGMGIQTGSDYISREVYGRRYGAKEIVPLAECADRLGFTLTYDFLSNSPFERETDCLATLRLIMKLPKPVAMTVKRLVVFPGFRIATLNKPRPNLPQDTFEFWNQLYLIARRHLVSDEQLLELSKDEYLKANPDNVRRIALGMKQMVEANNVSPEAVERLIAQERQVTVRGWLRREWRKTFDRSIRRITNKFAGLFLRQKG